MSAGKIILIVFVAVSALGALVFKYRDRLLPGTKVPDSIALPAELKLPPLAALTDSQKQAVTKAAQDVCAVINENRMSEIQRFFDYDEFLDRALSGFELPGGKLTGLKQGALSGLKLNEGGLLRETAGSKVRFASLRDINGAGGALIRVCPADGGIVFFYLMPRFTAGRVRFVDLYSVTDGCFTTENARDVMIPMLGSSSGYLARGGGKAMQEGMKRVNAARQSGDMKALTAACLALPPEMRERGSIRSLYLQALMSGDDSAAYQKELERIQRDEPESMSNSSKLIDLYIMKKQWPLAAAAALKLDAAVGGDAFIKSLAGMCQAWAGEFNESEKLLHTAAAMEPDLSETLSYRMHLECARGDFAAMIKTFDQLKEKFDLDATPEGMVEDYPAFQKFLESDEYKGWKAKQPQ